MKTTRSLLCLAILSASTMPAALAADEFRWRAVAPESQGMSRERLDELQDLLAARNTKALLVVRNDRIVYEWYAQGHGPDRRHYTASMAKALVGGVALALAIDDGRIELDARAATFIPQWRDHPGKSNITIRQLGSHTSGLEDAEAKGLPHDRLTGWKGDFWKRLDPPRDPFSISRDQTPLLDQPGAAFRYSNPGIAILGYAVTAALRGQTHQDMRTLIRDRVMRPIGVEDDDWAIGYGRTFRVGNLPLVAAWGGGSYTARAAARVGRLMLREGDWDGRRVLSPRAVRLTTRDASLPNGNAMGWWTNGRGLYDSLSRDAFWAAGAGHQTLLVAPGLNLICVRNGGDLAPRTSDEYQTARGPFLYAPLMKAVTDAPAD